MLLWRPLVLWVTAPPLLRYSCFLWKRLEGCIRTFTSGTLAVSWHSLLWECVCVCVSENTYGKVYMVLTDGSCVGEQHCIAAMGCCHFKWCKGAERKVVTSMCVCVLCVFCVWELSGSLPPVRSLQAQKHHICEVVQGQHKDWDQERCSSCVYVCVCVCVCVHSSLSF